MLEKERNKVFYFISTIALITGTIFSLALIYTKNSVMMNSDISADMLLGKLLAENGGFLSSDWLYSTELRVFQLQIVYKYLFRLFPNNWLMVSMTSTVVFVVLFISSFLYMCNKIGVGREGLYAASLLVWPFGQWYFRLVLYGHHYPMHFVSEFLSIGLFFSIVRGDKNKLRVVFKCVVLALFAFVFGLEGIRIFIICYAPLLVTVAICLWGTLNEKYWKRSMIMKLEKGDMIRAIVSTLVALAVAFVGLCINRGVLNRNYRWSDMFVLNWAKLFINNPLAEILSDFFALFGWHEEVLMVGVIGIINCVCFAFFALLLIVVFRSYKRLADFPVYERFVLVYFVALFVFTCLYLSSNYQYSVNYWVPLVPFVILIISLYIKLTDSAPLYLLVLAMFVVFSISTYIDPVPNTPLYDGNIYGAIEWLKDSDYTSGFATFWSSDVITEATDGRIEMWTIKDVDRVDDLSSSDLWLQEARHSWELPEGEFFVLVSARDYTIGDPESAKIFLLEDHLKYSDEGARIYGFTGVEDFTNAMAGVE